MSWTNRVRSPAEVNITSLAQCLETMVQQNIARSSSRNRVILNVYQLFKNTFFYNNIAVFEFRYALSTFVACKRFRR
jgi:hypothetical protein